MWKYVATNMSFVQSESMFSSVRSVTVMTLRCCVAAQISRSLLNDFKTSIHRIFLDGL